MSCEQIDLHPAPRDIATDRVAGSRGDFVDLVDVDDARLGQFDITIGGSRGRAPNLRQRRHISCSENFVASAFTKGTPISWRCSALICLPNARRTQQEDVLFGIVALL